MKNGEERKKEKRKRKGKTNRQKKKKTNEKSKKGRKKEENRRETESEGREAPPPIQISGYATEWNPVQIRLLQSVAAVQLIADVTWSNHQVIDGWRDAVTMLRSRRQSPHHTACVGLLITVARARASSQEVLRSFVQLPPRHLVPYVNLEMLCRFVRR